MPTSSCCSRMPSSVPRSAYPSEMSTMCGTFISTAWATTEFATAELTMSTATSGVRGTRPRSATVGTPRTSGRVRLTGQISASPKVRRLWNSR